MRWYWWLLIGLAFGAVMIFVAPMLLKSDKSESLEKARAAKAAKANQDQANETPASDTV